MGFCLFCRTDEAQIAPLETGVGVGICLPCAEGAAGRLGRNGHFPSSRSPKYVDDKDRVVIVSTGIGTSLYGAFRVKPDGRSLKRIISPMLPMVSCREEAQRNLDLYARHNGWTPLPGPEEVANLLLLVMEDAPSAEQVEIWTQIERIRAAKWAAATHLRASDNIVRVPPVPDVVMAWRKRKGS